MGREYPQLAWGSKQFPYMAISGLLSGIVLVRCLRDKRHKHTYVTRPTLSKNMECVCLQLITSSVYLHTKYERGLWCFFNQISSFRLLLKMVKLALVSV